MRATPLPASHSAAHRHQMIAPFYGTHRVYGDCEHALKGQNSIDGHPLYHGTFRALAEPSDPFVHQTSNHLPLGILRCQSCSKMLPHWPDHPSATNALSHGVLLLS